MKNQEETSLIMPVTPEFIERRIYRVRGKKVMIDNELAELYQVSTKVLNQAVQRNAGRFPEDFLIKLTLNEATALRSQFVTSNGGRGGRRYAPYAFTELGIAMLSSVLRSDRAIQMNVYIMRAFVKLREMLATQTELAEKIVALEKELKNTVGISTMSLLWLIDSSTSRNIQRARLDFKLNDSFTSPLSFFPLSFCPWLCPAYPRYLRLFPASDRVSDQTDPQFLPCSNS